MTIKGSLLIVFSTVAAALLVFVVQTVTAFRPSEQERGVALPGDDFIPRPMFVVTQAVTIDAPPARVWPWIAQMGADRAGWYSYDVIDNGGRPSADRLLPQFQRVTVGDLLPAVPGAKDGFIVLAVTPTKNLVLGGPADTPRGQRATWEFQLRPLDSSRTRLIVRGRVAEHWLAAAASADSTAKKKIFIERVYAFMARLPKPVLMGFAGFGHRVMQNQQLRGLKQRAEG